jgi:L-asparaginase II
MSTIEVVRGKLVESQHAVSVAVADATGAVVAGVGDLGARTYYRSAAKPFQALPIVEEGIADRFGLTEAELALCCASHEGEPAHVEGARAILAKAGLEESVLQCGAHVPFSPEAARRLARAGEEPLRVHNNCSGKHAGMAALAVGMGWDPREYHRAEHPVQRRMLHEISRWTEIEAAAVSTGVDGCGVPCFAVPLDAMAGSFARFAAASVHEPAVGRIVAAMTAHPLLVGGTGRTCTEVMETAKGRVFVKVGAEGVYGGGIPERGIGFAIKVADGGRRAVEVALIRTLEELGVLTAAEVDALSRHGRPTVRNTRGEKVGEVRAAFSLGGRLRAVR